MSKKNKIIELIIQIGAIGWIIMMNTFIMGFIVFTQFLGMGWKFFDMPLLIIYILKGIVFCCFLCWIYDISRSE